MATESNSTIPDYDDGFDRGYDLAAQQAVLQAAMADEEVILALYECVAKIQTLREAR